VPDSLDRAVLMCLAKTPEERPTSADVLGRMLEASTGTASWTPEDAERWWLVHRPENTKVSREDVEFGGTNASSLTTR
jgi:hypothetical protein